MNGQEKDSAALRREYDQFYRTTDFAHYPDEVSKGAVRCILHVCRSKERARVLDVGCGTGYYSDILHQAGCHVTGIDISDHAIATARERFPSITFVSGDALSYETAERFDCIFSLGMSVMNTRQLQNVRDYIHRMLGLLAPGGVLVFLGDSDLSGGMSRSGSWIYHRWDEILEMPPPGTPSVDGPYLTHFRLMARLPRLAVSAPVTFLLRYLPLIFPRKFLYLFRID